MPILFAQKAFTGVAEIEPNFVLIQTNDSLATVTTAGYLNHVVQEGLVQVNNKDLAIVSTVNNGVTSSQVLSISITGTPGAFSYNLVTPVNGGGSVFAGNVQAGINGGPAGAFISFPAGLNDGSLAIFATNSPGNFLTDITNAPLGQSTTFTIPDPGVAATNFILSNNALGQVIATGSLIVSTNNIQAGSNGHAGNLTSYPAGALSGFLGIDAVTNASGNFSTIISNAGAVAQSQTITIPDGGVAASNFIISNSAGTQSIATGNLTLALGNITATAGNIVATAGNITATAGTITATAGNVVAGSSGHAGTVTSFPAGALSGSLILAAATNASGNFSTTLSNSTAVAQSQVLTIPDVGAATGSVLVTKIANADAAADLVSFDVTVGQAALAGGGQVVLYASSGAKRYKIRSLFMNGNGTNFSGGGGDRLGQVSDGTTVYSVVPAANMQALTNNDWGTTALPFPAAAALNTSTAAGASLFFAYSNGATDYTAGSVVISGVLERVA